MCEVNQEEINNEIFDRVKAQLNNFDNDYLHLLNNPTLKINIRRGYEMTQANNKITFIDVTIEEFNCVIRKFNNLTNIEYE